MTGSALAQEVVAALPVAWNFAKKQRRGFRLTDDFGQSADFEVGIRAFNDFELLGGEPGIYQCSQVIHN
jgi:hypothetical protein